MTNPQGYLWSSLSSCGNTSIGMYNVNFCIQWTLSGNTTAMRDHLSWKTKQSWQKNLPFINSETCLERPMLPETCLEGSHPWQKIIHFSVIEPVTKDHLSWESTFLQPTRWSYKMGSTVIGSVTKDCLSWKTKILWSMWWSYKIRSTVV